MDKIKLFADAIPWIISTKKLEPPKFAVLSVDILQELTVFSQNFVTIFDFFLKIIKNTLNFNVFLEIYPKNLIIGLRKGI